jgi:hypothetical protein
MSLLYKPRVSNTWPLTSFYTDLLLMLFRLQYAVTLIAVCSHSNCRKKFNVFATGTKAQECLPMHDINMPNTSADSNVINTYVL